MKPDIVLYPERLQKFDAIEIHPMVFLDESQNLELAQPAKDQHPDFHAVFIHTNGKGLECIADCATEELAKAVELLITKIIEL